MSGFYGIIVKDLFEFLNNYNFSDEVYLDNGSLGGRSTKHNRDFWIEVNTIADEGDFCGEEGEEGEE
jgi:hypothetical protein